MKEEGVVIMSIDYDFSGTYENSKSVWADKVKRFGKNASKLLAA